MDPVDYGLDCVFGGLFPEKGEDLLAFVAERNI